jgi:hypothetical protein
MSKKHTTKFGPNVTPNFITHKTRSDGKIDTFYGKQGGSQHGHSVRRADGSVEYSRTSSGRHVK